MINNFATLLKRLEAATSRLEDIALSVPGVESSPGTPDHDDAASPKAVTAATSVAPTAAPAPSLPPTVVDFQELTNNQLAAYVNASKDLDSSVVEQTAALATAFKAQERFLLMSTKAKKPDMSSAAFAELLSSMQHAIVTVNDIKDTNRTSTVRDHLAMVNDGTGALSWIFETKPADYIGEVIGGIQMYGNRILKQHKESGPQHVAYVQAYVALWKGLQEYVKKNYPKGVTWNSSGVDLSEALAAGDDTPVPNGTPAPPPPPAPGAAGGPPPPPPPPLPVFDNAPAAPKAAGGGDSMGAIFDQLNRGEAVTAGLKKVDKSQMTHKNPALRATGPVPETDSLKNKAPGTKPKPETMRSKSSTGKKDGRKELDGNKWYIENFESPSAPIEIEVTLSHSILISRCKNTTIILRGKANAVSLDNCSRTNLILDNLVSSVDVVKCPNFALQVTGSLPTVMLDQVDGASLYLSNESLHTEVYTSKCSSINVVLPPKTEDDDSVECPVAEQIRTYVKNGKLVSEIVEHAG